MRNMSMIQVFLILICVLCYSVASGQQDYLVLTKGDTLYGKVKHLSYSAEQSVQLEPAGQKRKTTYTMLSVKAFQVDGEMYHLIRTSNQYTYMKLLSGGYLSLYAFQLDKQTAWNGRYLHKIDGSGMEVPTLGFKRKMTDFMQQCPVLVADIEEGNLGRNNLDTILERYNTCIIDKTSTKAIEIETETPAKTVEAVNRWSELESNVREADLADKNTLLEMIAEAKSKSAQGEKIPNFLKDALKRALQDNAELSALLVKAIGGE
ncbi:MAG: hypothetical protein KF845_12840 [Cyclobacteriaceae bacterium]|nr:hypothetical protein [Cyclobacteriaceae bacterium]